jgi:hypothetical protein
MGCKQICLIYFLAKNFKTGYLLFKRKQETENATSLASLLFEIMQKPPHTFLQEVLVKWRLLGATMQAFNRLERSDMVLAKNTLKGEGWRNSRPWAGLN